MFKKKRKESQFVVKLIDTSACLNVWGNSISQINGGFDVWNKSTFANVGLDVWVSTTPWRLLASSARDDEIQVFDK